MSELIVIREADATRKAICLSCEHASIYALVGEYDHKAMAVSPVDVFTCGLIKRQMPCHMRRMLIDPGAKCPHPNAEQRERWKVAAREKTGCGGETSTARQAPVATHVHPESPRGGNAAFVVHERGKR